MQTILSWWPERQFLTGRARREKTKEGRSHRTLLSLLGFHRPTQMSTPIPPPTHPLLLNLQAGNCVIPGMNLWSLSVWPFQISFYSPTNSLRAVTKVWARHSLTCGVEQWLSLISPHLSLRSVVLLPCFDLGHKSSLSFAVWGSGPQYLDWVRGPASEAVD